MKDLVRWMNGTAGRTSRAVAGLALVVVGVTSNGPAGLALAFVGVVALVAGGAGLCLLAPFAHLTLREGTH